ncbi:thioredoxin family protein [Allokutzneria albata]|uniref:Putative thioredoxin n=1 Tax=Allokutzneria albata TaxID=211114 RepID=A0A1G9SCM0_ALLAB|nr:thioredoxin family protein [Allokutzneria albata]SDM33131.1 putative thioredoxin [Allokutzneria albata]
MSLLGRLLRAGVAAVAIVAATFAAVAPATAAPAETALANENVVQVTSANHAQILEISKTKLVILDFGAEWCGPCRQMKPVIERLAAEYNGRFLLGVVNVDVSRDLSSKYRIQYLPTLVPVRHGAELPNSRHIGYRGETALRTWIDAQLAKG